MQKLLIATTNKGKLEEIKSFLKDLPVEILSLADVGITDDVEETGKTYEENSQKKALFYAKKSGLPAVADDGGLEIAALGGAPGIKSRRWLGYKGTDEELIAHLNKIAKELPENNRKAFFKTVVSLALPNGKVWSVAGDTEGIIAKDPKIQHVKGFPFRHFFYFPQIRKYYQNEELSDKEQKVYNHRYKAIEKLIPVILNLVQNPDSKKMLK